MVILDSSFLITKEPRQMAVRRPKYSSEFRSEAERMVVEGGRPIAEVARRLKIPRQTLAGWVRSRDHDQPSASVVRARRRDKIHNIRIEINF